MPSISPRYSLGVITTWTAGEAVLKGQYLYRASADTVRVAHADDVTTVGVIGAAFRAAAAGTKVLVVESGELRGLTGLTPGTYYLQASGFGGLVAPTGPGKYSLRVGFVKNATTFVVEIGPAKIRAV